ncbi:MAG: Crp/Fnr family transcriptional regulator [Elsteraceae bacterium]
MSLQQEVDLLRKVPMFANMDASQLKLLSFASERVSFMEGDRFIQQDEFGDTAFLIISGDAEVLAEAGGTEIPLGTVGVHQVVGDIALLHSGKRTATVRARTPMVCLKLTRDVFFHLVKENPDFALSVMRDLAKRLERSSRVMRTAIDERAGAASSKSD